MESQQSSELGLPLWFLGQQSFGTRGWAPWNAWESTEHPSAPGAASCCLGCCHGPESAPILWSDLKMMKAFGALHNWSVEIWTRLYFFIACVKTTYGWIKWSYTQFFFKIINNRKLPWQCKPREDVDANACAVKWALFRSCTNLLMPETLHRKLQAFKGFWNVSDTNCLPADVSVAVGVQKLKILASDHLFWKVALCSSWAKHGEKQEGFCFFPFVFNLACISEYSGNTQVLSGVWISLFCFKDCFVWKHVIC